MGKGTNRNPRHTKRRSGKRLFEAIGNRKKMFRKSAPSHNPQCSVQENQLVTYAVNKIYLFIRYMSITKACFFLRGKTNLAVRPWMRPLSPTGNALMASHGREQFVSFQGNGALKRCTRSWRREFRLLLIVCADEARAIVRQSLFKVKRL